MISVLGFRLLIVLRPGQVGAGVVEVALQALLLILEVHQLLDMVAEAVVEALRVHLLTVEAGDRELL